MSTVFIDTSAFFALLVQTDKKHSVAVQTFKMLASEETPLTSSSYVLVETYALLQKRAGIESVKAMRERMAHAVDFVWVDQTIHDAGMDALMQANRRKLSLVDCVSFAIMRRDFISDAFTYDKHFSEQGFHLL